MKKKNFLYPSREKVLSTFIVFGFVIAATFIWDIVSEFLVPSDLREYLSQASFQMLADKQNELIALGIQTLLLGAVINLFVIYFAICIIFNYFKK